MKVQTIDYQALLLKMQHNLIKIQEFLEEQDFHIVPALIDSFYSLIPCKSKVFIGKNCNSCSICLQRKIYNVGRKPCIICSITGNFKHFE